MKISLKELKALIKECIKEETLGTKHGIRYFQLGGSLPDKLYNLDKHGNPTRDPGIASLKESSSNQIFYHGSPEKIEDFSQKPWVAFDGETVKRPIWVSPDKNFAKLYAKHNGYIHHVKVKTSNIFPKEDLLKFEGRYLVPTEYGQELLNTILKEKWFDVEDEDDEYGAMEILKSIDNLDYGTLETKTFIDWLNKKGYDGFQVKGDGPINIAVLDKNKIKIVDREKV